MFRHYYTKGPTGARTTVCSVRHFHPLWLRQAQRRTREVLLGCRRGQGPPLATHVCPEGWRLYGTRAASLTPRAGGGREGGLSKGGCCSQRAARVGASSPRGESNGRGQFGGLRGPAGL